MALYCVTVTRVTVTRVTVSNFSCNEIETGVPVVVRVPPEGDFELLEELVHAGEQRLRRARSRVDRRRALEHDHAVGKVSGS